LTDNADKFTEGEAATKKAELDEALTLLKTDLGGANFESIKTNTEKLSTISQALGAMMYANASAQAEGAQGGSEDHVEDAEVIDAEEAN
jgi:molecular chaperone DnaK